MRRWPLVRRLLYDPAVRTLALAAVLVLAPACVLHLGDDDQPLPCKTVGDGVAGAPFGTFVVDPTTLVCVEGVIPCDGTCGACDQDPAQTWAPCQSQCTGLDANTCAATSGCRQAWDQLCLLTDAICTIPDNGYYGCFATDLTGPIQGVCDGLGAQDCSRHDDCLATYRRDERCANQLDDDGDTIIDEPDECLTFGLCMAEFGR